jgi:hypothetical protein
MQTQMIAMMGTELPAKTRSSLAVGSAIVQWVDRWQWELCVGIFGLCVLALLQTMWQVRREQQHKRRLVETGPDLKSHRR